MYPHLSAIMSFVCHVYVMCVCVVVCVCVWCLFHVVVCFDLICARVAKVEKVVFTCLVTGS
jgi:hypothetical protein